MTWILYAILTTGEAGPVPMSHHVCTRVAEAVSAGLLVTALRDDGSEATITAAACLGPLEADPCEMETGS